MKKGIFLKGHIPWNKGLNKSDNRVKKYSKKGSETKKKLSCEGKLPAPWNKGLKKEKDARLMNVSKSITGIKRKKESIEKSRINAGKRIREQYKNGERKWWGLNPKNKEIWEKVRKKFGDELSRQKARLAMGRSKQNKLERYFEKILEENFPNKYKFTGNGKMIIKGHFPDFTHLYQKKVILINGIFWHTKFKGLESFSRDQIEKIERTPYEEAGYKVLHIWEDELVSRTGGGLPVYDKDINIILDKLNKFDII